MKKKSNKIIISLHTLKGRQGYAIRIEFPSNHMMNPLLLNPMIM